MTDEHDQSPSRRYDVLLRVNSLARLADGVSVDLTSPVLGGQATATLRTVYADEGHAVQIPQGLWIVVSGPAGSLDAAVDELAGAGRDIITVLAFVGNAVAEGDVELAYDATPGVPERDFVQAFLPEPRGLPPAHRPLPRGGRLVNAYHVQRLHAAIVSSPHAGRLGTALHQYSDALANWRFGREAFALAHLYMGMEALQKPALDAEIQRTALSREQLYAQWGNPKSPMAELKRRILFDGRTDLYKRANEASNAFEHGFRVMSEVRMLALESFLETAVLLRRAILKYSEVSDDVRDALLRAELLVPLDSSQSVRFVRGVFSGVLGDHPEIILRDHPLVSGRSEVHSVTVDATGNYLVRAGEEITCCRAGVGLAIRGLGVLGAPEYPARLVRRSPEPDAGTAAATP